MNVNSIKHIIYDNIIHARIGLHIPFSTLCIFIFFFVFLLSNWVELSWTESYLLYALCRSVVHVIKYEFVLMCENPWKLVQYADYGRTKSSFGHTIRTHITTYYLAIFEEKEILLKGYGSNRLLHIHIYFLFLLFSLFSFPLNIRAKCFWYSLALKLGTWNLFTEYPSIKFSFHHTTTVNLNLVHHRNSI